MKNFYLIGLTGNLGSGKSTVRRMLEKLGASGLDVDALAHLAMRRGTATWFALVKTFGLDILTFSGKVDRAKLGARVFADADALAKLEAITHPAVGALTKEWLRETETSVVVVEAIKLIEAGMQEWCDALWVVQCAPEIQVERVTRDRQMSPDDARARLAAQGSLDAKLKLATVVIDNSGDEKSTRAQIERAWQAIQPDTARDKSEWLFGIAHTQPQPPVIEAKPVIAPPPPPPPPPVVIPVAPVIKEEPVPAITSDPEVRRARRSDLATLGIALAKREQRAEPLSHEQVLKRLGERGYRIAVADGRVIALAAWEAENLVAMMREVWAESESAATHALPKLFALIEEDARALLCEVSLVIVETPALAFVIAQARGGGYALRDINALHRLWQPVVQERVQPGDQIFVKQLRDEMITKPV
ncbi:MAG: dephospho-CoA kinase [Chloroflexi bacterium]|nr:dephospho-CoA kinase [Chloroflexota bacterium]